MKKYIVIFLLVLSTAIVKGQSSEIFINYLPAYSFGDYGSFSPRGVDFEVNRYIKQDISVGFVIAWNAFQKKVVGESLEVDGALVTGTQVRYQNFVPINIVGKKYFTREGDLTPYVGAGLGLAYHDSRTDIGIFSINEKKWPFNIAPEVGILYDLNFSTVVTFKVKYNYIAKAGSLPSVSYLSFGLGFGIN